DELGWISDYEMVFARDGQVLTRNERTGQEDTLHPGLAASFFNHPFFSHDTRILLYGTLGQMIAVDIETGERIPDLEMAGLPLGTVMNGYFLFRGLPNRREVWARKIDFGSRKYTSTGRALFESGTTAFSENGHLIYKPLSNPDEPLRNEPIFEYRLGKVGAFVSHAGDYTEGFHDHFQISADGRFLAVRTDKGIKRFERSSRTSIALVGSSMSAHPTEWSRDGAWLYYHETTDGSTNVYRIRSSANGEPEPIIVEQTDDRNGSISTDGRILVFERSSAGTGHDIWGKNLVSESEFPIVTVAGDQGRPRISPDSRLIAFQSGDADRPNVLISNLDGSRTVTVADGVSNPRWSSDGKYLYYESRTLGAIYRVQVLRDPLDESARSPAFGEPRLMFSEPRADHTHWAVTPDDSDTILLSWPLQEEKGGSQWKVVLNWAGTLG
ncbi:MAG: TolB family protein, partial [Rhodothermia bacterium]